MSTNYSVELAASRGEAGRKPSIIRSLVNPLSTPMRESILRVRRLRARADPDLGLVRESSLHTP